MAVIDAINLSKSYPAKGRSKQKRVEAVRGINISVEQGEVFGFLGPNGAGKSTTVRILATLIPADEGSVSVAGYDLKSQPVEVRRRIGYVSQAGGTDRWGSARENLVMQARLHGMGRAEAVRRADQVIDTLEMGEFADRRASGYSGGQRRKLDLALGMVHGPQLLFLDEPTTGLDPVSRAQLWDQVRNLKSGGTTVFLTTHYLDEADQLCDRVAIIDRGAIVAEDSPVALKRKLSGDVVTLRPSPEDHSADAARKVLDGLDLVREVMPGENGALKLTVHNGEEAVPEILRQLNAYDIGVSGISLSRPSLDDVFLKLTGHSIAGTEADPSTKNQEELNEVLD